jgi:F-type H+-transporting ATPase subunit b
MDFHDPHNWVALSFVVFVIIAWALGRKPVAAKLDSRIEKIRKDLTIAEGLRNEAQALLDEYRMKQQQASADAKAIVENARRHAGEIQRTAEADMEEAAKRREAQLQDRLKRMEENAANEIRAYAAELAVKATAELIAAHMDEKTNARLVDDSIKTLAKDAA